MTGRSQKKAPNIANKKIKLRKAVFPEPALLKKHTDPSQPKPKAAPFKKADSPKLRFIPSLPPRTADSTPVRLLKIKISQEKGAQNSLEIRGFEVYCKASTSLPSKGCKDTLGLDPYFIYCEQNLTQTFASCETAEVGA